KKFLLRVSTVLFIVFISHSARAQVIPSKSDTSKSDTTKKHELPLDTNRSDPGKMPMLPDSSNIPPSPPNEPKRPAPKAPTLPTEIPEPEIPSQVPPIPPK